MPKPPGVVGRLPEWQNGVSARKKGVLKIFLDFQTFAISAHINKW